MRSFDELRVDVLALFDRADALATALGAGQETVRRLAGPSAPGVGTPRGGRVRRVQAR